MSHNPGLHIKSFNDRVKVMNQTGQKDLNLSSLDARNLHADIFALLALISELTLQVQVKDEDSQIDVRMDGGEF